MLPQGEWLDLPEDPTYVEDIVRLHHDVKKQANKEACIAKLIQEDVVEVSSSDFLFDDYLFSTLWQGYEKDDNKEDDENKENDDEVDDDNEEEKKNGCNCRTSSILSILHITIPREVVVFINVYQRWWMISIIMVVK
jgi:hypothetical protein